MSFSVQLLPEAEFDFEEIYLYLYDRSEVGAANWAAAFHEGLERLRSQPETCGLADESRTLGRNLRQLLFGTKTGRTYRAVFIVEGNQVSVLRLRGPGQRAIRKGDLPRGR